MKKLFWVNILIFLSLFVSCATTYNAQEQKEIVSMAIQLADKQIAVGDYTSAIMTYNDALLSVNDYRFIYNKAIAMDLNENTYDAARLCSKASTEFPNQKEMFLKASGIMFIKSKAYDKAKEIYNQLISIDDKNKEYKYKLAEVLTELEDFETAYEIALSLWNDKNFDKRTIDLLYKLRPKDWSVVYKSFEYDSENSTD